MEPEYLRRRIAEERARSAAAACEQSRLAHEGLADCFERELRRLPRGDHQAIDRANRPQTRLSSTVSGVARPVFEVVKEDEPSAFRFGQSKFKTSTEPGAHNR